MVHREAAVSSEPAGDEIDAASALQLRIAHDLHDGVSQVLVGAALMANNLLERAPPALQGDLARLAQLLDEAMARVHNIARGLSPLHLGKLGVTGALKSVCDGMEASGAVECSLEIDDASRAQPEETVVELCLIAQEAMRNAVRHGRARHIDVRLARRESHTFLSIEDDGAGLQAQAQARPGLGLESMRLRARKLGGSLEIGSLDGGGLRVRCTWPNGPLAETG
ncbi:MAG TPA: ATP-binding protein [Polyangiaceae bacterium]